MAKQWVKAKHSKMLTIRAQIEENEKIIIINNGTVVLKQILKRIFWGDRNYITVFLEVTLFEINLKGNWKV